MQTETGLFNPLTLLSRNEFTHPSLDSLRAVINVRVEGLSNQRPCDATSRKRRIKHPLKG